MADYGRAISLSQGRDLSHTSDDDESEQHSPRSIPTLSGSACGAGAGGGGGGGSSSAKSKKLEMGSAGEISTKKPRGRPPGSKNKPKPPIVITKDSESGMKAVVLEISAGSDVVETLIHFARTRHVGITVLSGSGSVSNVTLRHPLTSVSHAPSLMSLHGPFALLSLSGSFMEYSSTTCSSTTQSSKLAGAAAAAASSFGICLAGAQGQVFGGIVGGKIIAASVVVVVAATFSNPAFHRLPTGTAAAGGGGDETDDDGEAEQHHHQETKHRCIVGNQHHIESSNISSGSTVAAAMSMSVNYTSVASPTPINCQITPDHHVMPWGPPSRPPY